MDYKPLYKVYYSDKNNYNTEYESRFNSLSTIRFDFKIFENRAFLVMTEELFNLLYDILSLNRLLDFNAEELPGIALNQYMKRCLIDEIVLTNEIEGVTSTRKDVFEVLETSEKQSKNKRLYGLVMKYLKLNNENISVKTCQDIRNIYDQLVLQEVLAENSKNMPDGMYFRKSQNMVVSKYEKVLHYGIMPEENINNSMAQALDILNDDKINILIRIAVFHYFFGYIHPFYDGNGRTSRFISSYLLSNHLNELTGYRLSYTIKENISAYYNSFKVTNDKKNKGDLTPFVINFFELLVKLLEKLITSIDKRREKLEYYADISKKLFNKEAYVNIAYVLFQNTLFGTAGISVEELVKATNYSQYAVRNCLDSLNEQNLLKIGKIGNKNLYSFDLEKF